MGQLTLVVAEEGVDVELSGRARRWKMGKGRESGTGGGNRRKGGRLEKEEVQEETDPEGVHSEAGVSSSWLCPDTANSLGERGISNSTRNKLSCESDQN